MRRSPQKLQGCWTAARRYGPVFGSLFLWTLPSAGAELEVTARAGHAQDALTVRVSESGEVWARACPTASCALQPTEVVTRLDVSAHLKAMNAPGSPQLEILELGENRRAVHVHWGAEPSYHLVLGAALKASKAIEQPASKQGAGRQVAAKEGSPVVVLHEGWSDRWTGLEGERVTSHVEVVGKETKQQLVVGELREDLSLCGRPALLAPQVLDPSTLSLKAARLQRLPARERKEASHVVAESVQEAAPGAMTLQALAASSAVGAPSAISDGDLETTWSEGGGGAGKGEFVVLRAPADVTLRGFELVARPPSGGAAPGVGPRSFWLVGDSQLVRVEVPQDPWATPGGRLRVELPEPWQTSCVAWVADEAYGQGADMQVTIAELVALPEDGTVSTTELVERVVAGGDDVGSAVSLLASRAQEAAPLVTAALAGASERARWHLLDVSDRFSCAESAPAYTAALSVGSSELKERAERGLRRCVEAAPAALVAALEGATPSAEVRLAEQLALLAPTLALETLTPRLAVPSVSVRGGLRQAIAQASEDAAAQQTLLHFLDDASLPERAQVDLLRALGDRVISYRPQASAAVLRLLEQPSFRTRYLLVKPAVRLAESDRHAAAFVSRFLRADESPAVRAATAEAIGEWFAHQEPASASEGALSTGSRPFEVELLGALSDENVRVREAAARALGLLVSQRSPGPLQQALQKDEWPLVRRSAADALGRLGPDEEVDRTLGRALQRDDAPGVRAASARALGRRGSPQAGEWLRNALTDRKQRAVVRQEAARALGTMCFAGASSALIDEALRLRNPHLEPEERRVAVTALRALARLRPHGLAKQLAPLLDEQIPKQVRAMVEKAIGPDEGSSCPSSGAKI